MPKAKSIKILAGQERKAKSAEAKKYNGERTPAKVKKKIADAILGSSKGVVEIASEFGVSVHTVNQIRLTTEDQNPELNRKRWKSQTAATLAHFSSLGAERLVQEVDRIPLQSLALSVAIAVDKAERLSEQPQVVVEHRLRVDHGGVEHMMKRANAAAQTSDIVSDACDDKVIDIPNKEA